jgi:UDP-N-acetylglucosamine acyltransferase
LRQFLRISSTDEAGATIEPRRTFAHQFDRFMSQIHPTAVVHEDALLGLGVSLGPNSVIEAGAVVGDACRLHTGAVVRSGCTLGIRNIIGEYSIVGARPQHQRAGDDIGRLVIGDRNELREHVTMHCAVELGDVTQMGDDNLLMVGAHVGHDCQLGSQLIIANNVLLGGHAVVEDHAYLSGAVAVHQFCRVGHSAMVGGQSHLTRDVPPYMTIDGLTSRVVGLNTIGLRRQGIRGEQIRRLKQAYRILYRSGLSHGSAVEQIGALPQDDMVQHLHDFLQASSRGCLPARRSSSSLTSDPADDVPPIRRVA